MSKAFPHLNLALVGKLENGVNQLTASIAQVAAAHGDVVAGDYLEKKALAGRKELFHIRYRTKRFECEHINVPLSPDNISKAALQADAVVLLSDIDTGICGEQQAAVELMRLYEVDQFLVLLDVSSGLAGDYDPELIELAELEAREKLVDMGASPNGIHCLIVSVRQDPSAAAAKIVDLIDSKFQSRGFDTQSGAQMWIEKVYRVSDKGLRNAPVAFGFLRSGIILRGLELTMLGLTTTVSVGRVRSVEVFGEECDRCEAGRSLAVLIDGHSKDLPRPGQILLAAAEGWSLAHEATLALHVLAEPGVDPTTVLGRYQQFEVLCNMATVTAHLVGFGWDDRQTSHKELRASVSFEKPLPVRGHDGIVISSGNEILASGRIVDYPSTR